MAELHAGLASWSSQVWPVVANHLWQSTLFVLALLPVVALLRRAPARVRYSLSLVAGAKFLLPSALLLVFLSRLAPEAGGLFAGVSLLPQSLEHLLNLFRIPGSGGATGPGHREVYCLLTLLWLAGSAGLAGRWIARQRAFSRRLGAARRMEQGPEAELLERVRRRLGLRRRVGLALLPGTSEPGVWRVFRPVLVLPEEMLGHLNEAELEAIFLHELVHVRRWDNLVASLHMALCCLFWFHPLLWLLDRRLLAEREEACDERVLELLGRAEAYAQGLLKAVRFGIGWRLAGVSSAHASNFGRRIERILASPVGRRSSLAERGFLGASVALLVAFSLAAGAGVPAAADRCELAASSAAASRPAAESDRCRLERLKVERYRPEAVSDEGVPAPALPRCDGSDKKAASPASAVARAPHRPPAGAATPPPPAPAPEAADLHPD